MERQTNLDFNMYDKTDNADKNTQNYIFQIKVYFFSTGEFTCLEVVFRLRRRLGYDLHHFEYQPKPFFSPGLFLQEQSQEKWFILDFAINEIFIFLSLCYFKLENVLAQ